MSADKKTEVKKTENKNPSTPAVEGAERKKRQGYYWKQRAAAMLTHIAEAKPELKTQATDILAWVKRLPTDYAAGGRANVMAVGDNVTLPNHSQILAAAKVANAGKITVLERLKATVEFAGGIRFTVPRSEIKVL